MSTFQRTSSKTKNSASGPKKASSPMPVEIRYCSASLAVERGSRPYGCIVVGSMMSQRTLTVVSSRKGSTTGVESSGMSIMSDSLMLFHPATDEPSNMMPSAKASASRRPAGIVVCCSLPLGSVNRRSTHFASLSLISFNVFSAISDSAPLFCKN